MIEIDLDRAVSRFLLRQLCRHDGTRILYAGAEMGKRRLSCVDIFNRKCRDAIFRHAAVSGSSCLSLESAALLLFSYSERLCVERITAARS